MNALRLKSLWLIAMLTLLALVGLSNGCTTVTPKIVHDDTPSFDGGAQTSGFLGYLPDGSGVISQHAADRYNSLIAKYGDRYTVPLKPNAGLTPYTNGTVRIDAEHNVKAQEMNRWRKSNL